MAADWQSYVTIGPGFSEPEKAQLARSLTDIAHFADGEGMALLREARANNSDQPVTLTPTRDNGGTRAIPFSPNAGFIQVDFNEDAYLPGPKGEHRSISLTASLTHELYHAADRTEDIDRQSLKTITRLLGLTAEESGRLSNRLKTDSAVDGISMSEEVTAQLLRPETFARELQSLAMPQAAEKLRAIPPGSLVGALQSDGIIAGLIPAAQALKAGYAVPRFEQDAVDFTRAILRKNYGPDVAVPDNYLQTHRANATPAASLPLPSDKVFADPGFTAAPYNVDMKDLGALASPPTVAPVPAMDKNRGR